jgi:hypothetical protein
VARRLRAATRQLRKEGGEWRVLNIARCEWKGGSYRLVKWGTWKAGKGAKQWRDSGAG